MREIDRRYMSASDVARVEQWEEETPTGTRLPRKIGKSTKGKKNVEHR